MLTSLFSVQAYCINYRTTIDHLSLMFILTQGLSKDFPKKVDGCRQNYNIRKRSFTIYSVELIIQNYPKYPQFFPQNSFKITSKKKVQQFFLSSIIFSHIPLLSGIFEILLKITNLAVAIFFSIIEFVLPSNLILTISRLSKTQSVTIECCVHDVDIVNDIIFLPVLISVSKQRNS